MASSQLARWAKMHPTAPRTGNLFEIPFWSHTFPRILGIVGLAGVVWSANYYVYGQQKPATWDPAFIKEAEAIGEVSQRMNGPPVFRNPIRNRIPGNILGPEDLKKEFEH